MSDIQFDWDAAKNRENIKKHRAIALKRYNRYRCKLFHEFQLWDLAKLTA